MRQLADQQDRPRERQAQGPGAIARVMRGGPRPSRDQLLARECARLRVGGGARPARPRKGGAGGVEDCRPGVPHTRAASQVRAAPVDGSHSALTSARTLATCHTLPPHACHVSHSAPRTLATCSHALVLTHCHVHRRVRSGVVCTRWVLGAYSSFLFTVSRSGTLSLGVHPFAQTKTGVQPWLHPIFFVDIGKPNQTESLIEFYRVAGHTTYARRFENGLTLYNPEAVTDTNVPLGDAYVDPFDRSCTPRTTHTLSGQSGAVLVRADTLTSWTESDVGGSIGSRRTRRRSRRRSRR